MGYGWSWTWSHGPEYHFEVLSWLSLHLQTLLSLGQEGTQVKESAGISRIASPTLIPCH